MRAAMCVLTVFLILAAVSCGTKTDNQVVDAGAPVDDSTASADGVMIQYTVQGSGEKALVFIHGWSCDRTYWDAQTAAFKDDYTVVTIDLAGHGESGLDREVFTLEAFGEDVAAVVLALDLKDAVLIGHSMGGKVIVEAARLVPDRVVALVGADTFQDLKAVYTAEQMQAFVGPFRQDFVTATDAFVRSMFPETADSALVARVAEDMSSAPPAVGLSCFEVQFAYDAQEPFTDMRKPVRAINCDLWPTNVEGNRELAESFEILMMPGVGHFVQLEDPALFNSHLKTTVEEFWPAEQH